MESEKISKFKPSLRAIKDIVCAIWGECAFVPRKEITAEELGELCEMMSPSFSCFMKHLYKQGIRISHEHDKHLSLLFDMAFDYPPSVEISDMEIYNKKLNELIGGTRRVWEKEKKINGRVDDIDFSFLDSMIPDNKKILTWIEDKGLEKHIIFYEYHSHFVWVETFLGAVKQFWDERFNRSDESYSDDVHGKEYKNKWSFIFNKYVPKDVNKDAFLVSSIIEIKNLKIIGSRKTGLFRINFERFTCVVFNRNIFCESVHIEATRRKVNSEAVHTRNGFIFYKNIFSSYDINFKDIHYLIFDQNNFKGTVALFHYPRDRNNLMRDKYERGPPIIRLINNKARQRLSIHNRDTEKTDSAPIKIEFMQGNWLTGLSIDMGNNKLGLETVKSDIENISFDIQEEIRPIHANSDRLRQYKVFFLKLKNQAIEKKDRYEEFNYARKERYFDWQLSSRLEDRFVFWWSDFVSDSGISWGMPLLLLFISQLIFIGFPVSWITEDCELGVRLAIETLNPLTTLSEGLSEDLLMKHPYLIPTLTILQKIFLSILLYEIIKVLRRFSK